MLILDQSSYYEVGTTLTWGSHIVLVIVIVVVLPPALDFWSYFFGHKYPMRWLACNVLKRCFHIWVLLNSIYSVSILINIWGRPDSTKLRKADLLQDRRLMEDLYNHSAHIFSRCCAKISEMMSLNSARTRKHKCKDCINLILQWKRN